MQMIPLLSWDFITTGACHWSDGHERVPCDTPEGVQLRVEAAAKSAPMLVADRPWELKSLAWAQVMEDGGLYRMWYGVSGSAPGTEPRLCYAESDDGMSWRKPELGLIEMDGSAANNLVLHGPGANHFHVFKDPTSPPAARYRCMMFKSWWEGAPGEVLDNDEGHRRLGVRNMAKPGEKVPPASLKGVMMGLNSPDGLKWTMIEKPILEEWHDTHNICAYDEALGKYRGYFRGFYGGRRAISYAETNEFERWPPTHVIHHHVIEDAPGDQLYSNCYTRYPDVPRVHLLFPALYHLADDTVDGQLAVSLDGLNWSRHTRRPIIPHGEPGQRDEGHVYPEPDLIRFRRDGKLRLPLRAGAKYHNQAYNWETYGKGEPNAFVGWAEWPEERLAGIHAGGDGHFTIPALTCGDRLLANFRTAPDGWVRFELVDRVVWPPMPVEGIQGCRFDDAQPLSGDETHAPVVWAGKRGLSELQGKRVCLRVRLHKATLFAVTMYGAEDKVTREDPRYPV